MLRCLESISDQIHQQRQDARARKELGWRRPGVGAEAPTPPPEAPHNPTPSQIHPSQTDTQKDYHPLADVSQVNVIVLGGQKKISTKDTVNRKSGTETVSARSVAESDVNFKSNTNSSSINGQTVESESDKTDSDRTENTGDVVMRERSASARSTYQKAPVISVSELVGPDRTSSESGMSTDDNAEIMRNIQQAKQGKLAYLHPRLSSDNLLDDMSDTDSIGDSIASATMLDDQQIENLMLETNDYASVLDSASQLSQDDLDLKRNSLPPSLSYLENYVHFRQESMEDSPDISDTDDLEAKGERPDGNGSSLNDECSTSQSMHKTDESTEKAETAHGESTQEADELQRASPSQESTKEELMKQSNQPPSPLDEKVLFAKKKGFKLPLKSDEELEYFV